MGVRTTPSGSWGGLWQPQDGGTLLGGGDWPRKADPEGAVRGSGRGSVRVGSGAGLRVLGATAGQDLGRRQVVLGALRPSSALPGQTSQGSAETPPRPRFPDAGPEAQEGSRFPRIAARRGHGQDSAQKVGARPTITTHPRTLLMPWVRQGLGGRRWPLMGTGHLRL